MYKLTVNTVIGAKVVIYFQVAIREHRIYEITLCRAPDFNKVNSQKGNYDSKSMYH
jgi:hypothetical protein